jgi:thiol-disulfide isomerase/thioredoxin
MRTFVSILICASALLAGENAGRRAPGFALPDSNLKMYDLADYRGKVLVLEFFQTDCGPCVAFAPVLKEAQQKYGDKIAILAVANVPHDNATTVARYLAATNAGYAVIFDQGQMEFSYLRKTTIDNPYLFVIDGNGVIRDDVGYGAFTRDVFEGKGLFPIIERVLNSNASVIGKPMDSKK